MIAGLYGQEKKKHYVGGHFSYGKANYSADRWDSSSNKEYTGKDYFTLAIDYAYRTSENTEFCLGLSATLMKMDFENTVYWNRFSYTYDDSFGIFSIPVGMKYYVGKYFYGSAGLSFNYHPYKGYRWGLGGFVNIGAEYTFKSGLSLSVAPQVQGNILSLGNSPSSIEETLTQIGFNTGIGYRF
jgi:hypothetical protein